MVQAMLFSSFPEHFAMSVGPNAPLVTSAFDLTKAPFKQCGANVTMSPRGYYVEKCNPGAHGRYMYIYDKRQEPSTIHICEIDIDAASRYQPIILYH